MKQDTARVLTVEKVLGPLDRPRARAISGGYLMWLECPQIAAAASPGQYVMVRCGADAVLPRPISIHRVAGGRLALLFVAYDGGRGTVWLSQRKAGDIVTLFGPLGNGFSVSTGSKSLLLMAGGIGIAPLCFLADEALRMKKSVTLLYGTADKSRYLDLPKGVQLVPATEDGSLGHKGMITQIAADFAGAADQVFACGPLPMYLAMAKMAALERKQVQVSLEVRMGCGRGVCYGCTVKTKSGLKKVCEDGPVFDLDEIMWEELGS